MQIKVNPTEVLLWVLGLLVALAILVMPLLSLFLVAPAVSGGTERFLSYVIGSIGIGAAWLYGGPQTILPVLTEGGLMSVVLALAGPVTFGSLCAFIASRRGLNVMLATVLGVTVPIVGIIVTLMMPREVHAGRDRRSGKSVLVAGVVAVAFVLAVPAIILFASQERSGVESVEARRGGYGTPPQIEDSLTTREGVEEVDVPTITGAVGVGTGVLRINFSDGVIVTQPEGVKVLTNNAGVMSLHERALCGGGVVTGPRYPASGEVSTLCFKTSEDAAINSESKAIRMVIGGGSAIQGQDDVEAITTFTREVPID